MNEPESLLPCHRTDLPKALLRELETTCDEYKNQHLETGGENEDCSFSIL